MLMTTVDVHTDPPEVLDREEPEPAKPRRSLVGVVGRFAGTSVFVSVIGLVTGPITARALGPSNRGDLAAIVLPLNLAPTVLALGLGTYILKETANRRPLGTLVGSVGSLILLMGVCAAAAGPALADLFAGGREDVYFWVLIGFLLMPVSLFGWILADVALGLERWNLLILRTVTVPVLSLIGLATLYALDDLTVNSAAAVTLVAGMLAIIPTFPVLRQIGRPRFDRRVSSASLKFGSKAWIGGLGSVANIRLDQLLMIRLVSPHELGLYVVAITASTFFVNPLLSGLTTGMMPRYADHNLESLGRVLRMCLLGVATIGAAVAIVTPVAVPLLYGGAFSGAIPLVWLLVLGSIPLAGVNVLSTALTVGGRPGFSATSEFVALAVTVPSLILVLPVLGAVGAALVSLLAYSVNFVFLLVGTKRVSGHSWRELLVIRRSDLVLFRERISGRLPARFRPSSANA
jgi:O-antigen/teichoic acid export membrane protein